MYIHISTKAVPISNICTPAIVQRQCSSLKGLGQVTTTHTSNLGLEHWNNYFASLKFLIFNGTLHSFSGISEHINLYNFLVRLESSSLSPRLSPCNSSGFRSRRQYQKTIKGFDCKIKGQALGAPGAVLQNSLGFLGTLSVWDDRYSFLWGMEFQWISWKLVTEQSSAHFFAQWFIGLWVKVSKAKGQISMFWIKSCVKHQI